MKNKALCAITYVTVNNVVRITKDKFIKALNKLIDNICIDVNNLNKSISESLNQIGNKMNGLKYTSFFLDTNYCRQSLNNQRKSLHDFKNELSHYEARMETMEDRIIGKLNSIECDC